MPSATAKTRDEKRAELAREVGALREVLSEATERLEKLLGPQAR